MIRIRPGQREDAAAIADFQVRMADETEGIALHRQKTYRAMGMDDGRYDLFEWMSSGR